MDQMNYNHLRYFWAVAHDGNLTRTAERLNLSQSALSTQIKTLEERLGHALFERRGRALHLTEAGRIALDHADTIFATGAELLGTLNQTGAARKALRVGALATLSRNFQIGFLRPLLGREDVDVILRSGTASALMRGLESLNLDIILLNQAPPADALTKFVVNRLDEQPVSLVGAPERLENARDLRDLLSRQPVLLPNRESSIRTGFDALTDRLGLQPQIAAEVDDMAMLRLLARENVGLALVPPIVVRDELASRVLSESPFDLGIAEAFFAVRLERRFPNPLLKDLLDDA
ncbi:MAG: LysR family transcriptional regulator [Pseudomonadota bacterium]